MQLRFVNRLYALARFFVTLLATFRVLPAVRALELAAALRDGVFAPLEAGFPAFPRALAPFLEVPALLAADLDAFLAVVLAPFLTPLAVRFAAPAFLDALAPTAPIAVRMRLISRATCSMVIMPSTVSSLRRSE